MSAQVIPFDETSRERIVVRLAEREGFYLRRDGSIWRVTDMRPIEEAERILVLQGFDSPTNALRYIRSLV